MRRWIGFGVALWIGAALWAESAGPGPLSYAKRFTVERLPDRIVVEVGTPWKGATESFRHILIPRGAKLPADLRESQVIRTPLRRVVTQATPMLPLLDALGVIDTLVGVDQFKYVNTPAVRDKIDAGKLCEVGGSQNLNLETVVSLQPDVVLVYGMGSSTDAHPQLVRAGIPIAMTASYMEESLLGRSEWIKYFALFYEKEDLANEIFENIRTRYEALAGAVRGRKDQPTVFCNAPWSGTWHMPGGRSWVAQLLRDAGANYLWSDDEELQSIHLDFESVYARAAAADIWLNPSAYITSMDQLVAMDPRFKQFGAQNSGNVYNNSKRLSPEGGNDIFESGMLNPDVVLRDLIKIFHPGMYPEEELVYHIQLK